MSAGSSLPSAAEILAEFYEAETIYVAASEHDRDFDGGMGSVLAPDMKAHHSADLPWGGIYEGRAGFKQLFEKMSGYFSSLDVLEPKVFESADATKADQVVVLSTLKVTMRESGKSWIGPLAQSVTVDREKGWITEIRTFFWNVAGLNQALSL